MLGRVERAQPIRVVDARHRRAPPYVDGQSPKAARASSGEASSRPAARASAASAATNSPFEAARRRRADRSYLRARCADRRRVRPRGDAAARFPRRPMAVTLQRAPAAISRSRIGSSSGSAGMPDSTPMTKLYLGGRAIAVVARDRRGGADDAGVETFELRLDAVLAHHGEKRRDLLDGVVEQHRRPRPGAVGAGLQIIERAGVERGDLRPHRAQARERARRCRGRRSPVVWLMSTPGRRRGSRRRPRGDLGLPGRQMALAGGADRENARG